METIELIAKMVAIAGGLIAAFKLLIELKENRIQRHRELRWKQADSARAMIREMTASKLANDATIMLEWTGREFEILPGKHEAIFMENVNVSLRTSDLSFTDLEVYVRDCMDAFLFHVEMIEQAIQNDLIEVRDVKFPFAYYCKVMQRNKLSQPLMAFIKEYEYVNAASFFSRF